VLQATDVCGLVSPARVLTKDAMPEVVLVHPVVLVQPGATLVGNGLVW